MVSVEGPEAHLLADQMSVALTDRRVTGSELREAEKLQRLGFVNRAAADFQRLAGQTVRSVRARGATIRLAMRNGTNLLIAPEYGGRVLLHADPAPRPAGYHLALGLDDGRLLSIRLTGMGFLRCDLDEDLPGVYVYRRDFSDTPDPLEEPLTLEKLTRLVLDRPQVLRSVLVGREAVVVGIFNAGFQDIAYRAGLHPRRKASGLTPAELDRLQAALHAVLGERLRLGGKTGFLDLQGRPGRYEPAMGPEKKGTACPVCGSLPEQLSLGGGRLLYCPGCQR